jgi:hypothetical protein
MWHFPYQTKKRFRLRLDATFEATDMEEAVRLVNERIRGPEFDHPRSPGQVVKVDKPLFFSRRARLSGDAIWRVSQSYVRRT